MNANATPDSPVQDAADAPAAEEPSWIEIGSPKRWNAPPAWSDETAQNAWNAADELEEPVGGAGEETREAAPARFELVEAPVSADEASHDPSDEASQGSADEALQSPAPPSPAEMINVPAPARPVDDWVQGPVSAETEPADPAPIDPTELAEPTEQLEVQQEQAVEQLTEQNQPVDHDQPVEQSPAPSGLDDPESGDRWQVVHDADSPSAEDVMAEAATPTTEETPTDDTAQLTEPAELLDGTATPATAATPTAAPAPEPVTAASLAEPAPVAGRAADDPAARRSADEPDEHPALRIQAQKPRPRTGTLSAALDLVGPHLQARRPALVVGLVALVLSVWMLVALPFPLKYSIDAALAVAGTEVTAPDGIGADPSFALLIAAGALTALVVLQAGFRALSGSVLNRVGGRVATDLRGRLLSHLQHLSPGRDIDDLGRTATPLVQDVARLRDLVAHTGPRILGGLLALASLLGVVLVVEPIAAAIVVVTAGLFALVTRGALQRQRRLETAAAADETVLADTADELLAATATIQSYGLEQRAGRTLGELGTRAARSRSAARRTRAVGRLLAELITGLGVGTALLVGSWRMAAGTMSPGELAMVIAYVLLAVILVREVVQHAVALPGTRTAAARVGELLEHRAAITDPRRSQPIGRLRGEVVYSALSAEGSHGTLFDRISLVIPAGQHVAFVGREGHEAAALLSYLLRFEEPDTGRVLLDRFDTRALALADLRRQLAVVQREPALFTETVRENIRVGRPDASEDEIVEAARRSGADEFITLLPDGYDTLLTRRGAGLSDGQRRRIAITRALLRDAPVVVLDGADEELAPAEREEVRRALEVLAAGRTALLSSREPESVLAADRVLCFESGDLAEDGAPGDLAEDPDSWLATWLHAADVDSR